MKTGRLAPDYSKPRLWLEDYYVSSGLPTPPQNVDRMSRVSSWPMYQNDVWGDCTIAGLAHLFGATSTYAKGVEVQFTTAAITAAYEANCPGFDPVTDANDNGCVMQNVLQWAQTTGMDGNFVTASAQLKSTTPASLKLALYLFGSVYIGVNLPESAEQQFGEGQAWTYVQGSPIAGGHCVVLQKDTPGYPNEFTAITWGAPVRVQDEWLATYLEEAWVAVTPDWIQSNQQSIDGINIAGLVADSAAI